LLERFFKDDAARARIAQDMRAVVLQKFSYDARWRQFLEGLIQGMADTA
jgi:hypothetical protein